MKNQPKSKTKKRAAPKPKRPAPKRKPSIQDKQLTINLTDWARELVAHGEAIKRRHE